jgi:4-amino-4-deoxy-L-arabinose transferase-like glycosyltransferase
VTLTLSRPSRGAVATGVGAAAVALALPLPWISIPGDLIARELLLRQGEAIPATGSVFRASPQLAVLLVAGVLAGALVAFLSAAGARLQVLAAGATAGYAAVLLAVLVVRLFADRVAGEYTAIGAGGYLAVVGIAAITLGALTVVNDVRTARPPPARRGPRAAPESADDRSATGRWPWAWSATAGALILGAYLATRLSFVDRFPYFFDEGIYSDHATLASKSRDDLFVALKIGQGPVMTWLSVAWIKLGAGALTAVRLVSVISGLLTVAVIGLLARYLWDATVGWVAAALCVVLPFFLVHDGIGIYEPLVTLIMAGALLLQVVFARSPDLRLALLLGLVLGVGVLTKQNTLPALALLPVSLLCFDWSQPGRRRRLAIWISGVAIVVLMVVAADAIQRSSAYYAERQQATKDILVWPARSTSDVLDDPFGLLADNWATYRPALLGYVTIPLLLAAAAGAGLVWRARPRLTAVLLSWILLPFAVGMLFQLRPYPRHAMFLVPPLIALAAYGLVGAARLARRRLPPRAALAACAAGAALALAPAVVLDARVLAHPATARYPGLDYWQYVAGWPAGGPWRGATDLIRRRGEGPQVVVLTPGAYDILRQSLGEGGRYVLVTEDSPLASRAQFGLFDTAGFPVDPKGFEAELTRRGFARIARFDRPSGPCSEPREPDCGGSVVVFQRP